MCLEHIINAKAIKFAWPFDSHSFSVSLPPILSIKFEKNKNENVVSNRIIAIEFRFVFVFVHSEAWQNKNERAYVALPSDHSNNMLTINKWTRLWHFFSLKTI